MLSGIVLAILISSMLVPVFCMADGCKFLEEEVEKLDGRIDCASDQAQGTYATVHTGPCIILILIAWCAEERENDRPPQSSRT